MKVKNAETPFAKYMNSLSLTEATSVSAFFTALNEHMELSKTERGEMVHDFQSALLYYASTELSVDEALARLSVSNLGAFYVRPSYSWYALDNAAKIYPLSLRHGQMAIFRLSVYLKKPVAPELLQIALIFTIKRFPSFATTVKKGFFWHYLDVTKRRYSIEPETEIPCRPLQIAHNGSPSFRIVYRDNRISVEFFHILTDGTGGMVFLKTLTTEYLRLLGKESSSVEGILSVNDISTVSENANEFSRATGDGKAAGFAEKPATQFSGKLSRMKPCRVIHYKLDADTLHSVAKSRGATITAYILALMFLAGKQATDGNTGTFNYQVPVNMRKFYPSPTLRNFSMYCGIRLPISSITTLEEILPEITRQLREKASKEAMSAMMRQTERLVSSVRYLPLFIKSTIARAIYGFLGDAAFSSTLSNIGVVSMPAEITADLSSMDFVLGPSQISRVNCAMVTFGSTAMLTLTKTTVDPTFEEALFELLIRDGIPFSMEGSELYAD